VIDLSKYVGKQCVVQLRGGEAWLVCHQDVGKAQPVAQKDKTGNVSLVPIPFLVGTVVQMTGGFPVMEVIDENKQKLHIELNPDAILSVSLAVDMPRVQLVGIGG